MKWFIGVLLAFGCLIAPGVQADECAFGINGTEYVCFYEGQVQGRVCVSEGQAEPCVTVDNHHSEVFDILEDGRDWVACVTVNLSNPVPCIGPE